MKTAMQELQTALEIDSRHNKGTRVGKAIDIILSAFPKLLEAEKEQIIDAHRNGQNDAYADGCTWYRTAEEYYQQPIS